MLDGPRSIISGVLAAATVLLILAVIGVVNQKVPMGMGAVGDGIGDIFKWGGELVSHI
jgi:hypothetical protein